MKFHLARRLLHRRLLQSKNILVKNDTKFSGSYADCVLYISTYDVSQDWTQANFKQMLIISVPYKCAVKHVFGYIYSSLAWLYEEHLLKSLNNGLQIFDPSSINF